MDGETSKKKRKYISSGSGKNDRRKFGTTNHRPKRGGPGMLLTCETGRERKCEREGLEILNYYLSIPDIVQLPNHENDQHCQEQDEGDATATLTLEDELNLLKSKKKSRSAFGVYETSCRGTIFVLCTIPNCNLIPAIQTEYMLSKKNTSSNEVSKNSADDIGNHVNDDGSDSNKTIKIEKANVETGKGHENPSLSVSTERKKNDDNVEKQETDPWDPISTLKKIMADIDDNSNKAAPRSRFVTRMIPIQATCFASPEELKLTSLEVLKKYVSQATKTFGIVFKRRNCSNLNRAVVIKIVGDIMSQLFPKCKVKLDRPDATILVEVCGTLCGMSVIKNCQEYRKFNLIGQK